MHQLSHTVPVVMPGPSSEAFGAAQDHAAPERLPWGSAALVLTGLCLVLWAAIIGAVIAIV